MVILQAFVSTKIKKLKKRKKERKKESSTNPRVSFW